MLMAYLAYPLTIPHNHGVVNGCLNRLPKVTKVMSFLTKTHPDDLLGDVVTHKFVSMIRDCEDPQIDLESIQKEAIDWAYRVMNAANWPAVYQHDFLVRLRSNLTELTDAHPVTRQFVQLLTIELEFN